MGLFRSANFSGSNYLNITNYTGNPAAFSVSHWVYPSTTQLSRIFFANFLTGGTNKGWATGISDSTNNKIKFYLGTNTLSQTGTIANSTWTHCICTWDGTTAKIYLNGNTTPDNTLTSSVVYGTVPTNNYIGTLDGTNQDWNGRLAGVGYWSKALSTTEVTNLYNGGAGLSGSELSGSLLTSLGSYYDFTNAASLGVDSSGNSHTYTNTGTVTQASGPGLISPPYRGRSAGSRSAIQVPWSWGLVRAQPLQVQEVLAPDPASRVRYGFSGTVAWTRNAYGACMAPNDSTGQGSLNLVTPIASGATAFTLSALATLDTATGGQAGLRHLWAAEGTPTDFRLALQNGALFMQVGADGAFTNLMVDPPALSTLVLITCRLTAAGVRSIWYGPVKVAERTDASCAWGSGGQSLSLGSSIGQPARNWSGQINGGYAWTRALADAEIVALASDFYAPVRQPYPLVWAPAVNPVFAAALLPAM